MKLPIDVDDYRDDVEPRYFVFHRHTTLTGHTTLARAVAKVIDIAKRYPEDAGDILVINGRVIVPIGVVDEA